MAAYRSAAAAAAADHPEAGDAKRKPTLVEGLELDQILDEITPPLTPTTTQMGTQALFETWRSIAEAHAHGQL